MLTNDQRGRWAEEKAKALLQKKGYKILKERFKSPYGEVELIIRDNDFLVAVEVKYRRSYQDAADSISLRQRKRIAKALVHFLNQQKEENVEYSFLRFDVVLLCQTQNPVHIFNAWQTHNELYEF